MLADDFFLGTKLYQQKFIDLCRPIINYLGITHAIYVNVDKEGRMFSVCTDQKWMQRLLEERYYILDPLMVHPANIHNGFSFDSASMQQDFKDTLLYDAVVNFNWCNSFAYIEKTPNGGYFGFDFGTSKENFQIFNRLLNESHIIKKFIRDLNSKLIKIAARDIQENKMDFAALKGENFYQQRGLVFHEEHDNKHKVKLLKEAGLLTRNTADHELLTTVSLSPQEINCIRSYIATHSIKKVANELDLAITTVSSYIENVKSKLCCNNKNELFSKAEILESLGII